VCRLLPARSQWLPSVWDIGQACEREMEPIREAARREAKREHTRRMIEGVRTDRSPEAIARVRERADGVLAGLPAGPRAPEPLKLEPDRDAFAGRGAPQIATRELARYLAGMAAQAGGEA
jgi:hypothetical protein